jgi:hypothetical protein
MATPAHGQAPASAAVVAVLLTALGGCSKGGDALAAAAIGNGPYGHATDPGRTTWQQLRAGGTPGQDSPSAGEDAALAYDGARHRLLLFGGKGDDDKNRNELWSFDLEAATWQQIRADGPQPPPREDHTLVVDTGNDQLVLFGGEDGDTSAATWTFDLREGRWQEITHASAPELESHCAIYDPQGKRMVVFGGMREIGGKHDLGEETWLLCLDRSSPQYATWSALAAGKQQPAPRREHRGVYDPVRHRMLVFGGRQRSNVSYLNDVWVLDLASGEWHEVATHGDQPNPIRQMALGYDAATDELTVFGGEVLTFMAGHDHSKKEVLVNKVWVLDLHTGCWEDDTPYPPPMYDHAGVFVPEYGATLIYGGSSPRPAKKEHATWVLHTPAAPRVPTNQSKR